MKRRFFPVVVTCLLTMFFAALAGAPAGGATDPASAPPASTPSPTAGGASTVTCDFSNPAYSGWCRVTKQLRRGARPRGFCTQVLACLNDTRCIRTYCNATTIRGGWKLESVETPPKAQ
jgi:hypothetical protein